MNKKATADNKISITRMCGGGKYSLQMYGPHSLREDGTIIPLKNKWQ